MTFQLDSQEAQGLRSEMVFNQLERRGIHNPDVLQVFKKIPRHIFIPHVSLDEAYADHPIPIQAGQTISQPYMVALMLEYLELNTTHRVLEIGSGSGYATALLATLAKHVDAMEVYRELIETSSLALATLRLLNIQMIHQSAWEQSENHKVYDRIVLWASPPRIPEHIFTMLSDGGVLVAPEGKAKQFVWVFKKDHGQIKREKKEAVRFVPLVSGSTSEIDGSLGE